MPRKWHAPPPGPQDLPICLHPGCGERAPFGYGVSRTSQGRHFCGVHRPDRPGASAVECVAEPEPMGSDLFAPRRLPR